MSQDKMNEFEVIMNEDNLDTTETLFEIPSEEEFEKALEEIAFDSKLKQKNQVENEQLHEIQELDNNIKPKNKKHWIILLFLMTILLFSYFYFRIY